MAEVSEQPANRELFNVQNHMHNKQVVYFTRVYAAIVGGVFTGLVGVTGFIGVLHMVAWQVLFSGLLLLKRGTDTGQKYFLKNSEIMWQQAFNSTTLLTFILFWTFAYSMAYVF
mmetsp:Transcript_36491/g.93256  ORF Transcript_36491/g.93256 Transcript_36491/m.93256 type:complete len:114 (-) Transcript_36491:171-512(-)|eukprot:jgi/Tetstr1/461000/TSEL_006151.t1